jgi:hypothetical protein
MAIRDIYKTGQTSPADAYFEWLKYSDQTVSPAPDDEERKICLNKGDALPSLKSSNRESFWRMVSYRS